MDAFFYFYFFILIKKAFKLNSFFNPSFCNPFWITKEFNVNYFSEFKILHELLEKLKIHERLRSSNRLEG